uniref:Uncharacterized protein n=1 Tax=Arundo donax TaxID=35708 RepID=A0A0A9F5J7_ARUDO
MRFRITGMFVQFSFVYCSAIPFNTDYRRFLLLPICPSKKCHWYLCCSIV